MNDKTVPVMLANINMDIGNKSSICTTPFMLFHV